MYQFQPPYFGAAYYPEGLSRKRILYDIAQMKETGINAVRIAEFAWSRLEPEEGRFDFDWMHWTVQELAEAGIAVILCTPSATPPIWLTEKIPEILPMAEDGRRTTHGARQHFCPNNEDYEKYVRRFNERLVREFDGYENVIGWQVDNEVYLWQRKGCFCPVCREKFHRFLKERYQTIHRLNDEWQTTLWSQEYRDFDEIPLPRSDVWTHPALKTAWLEFQEDSIAAHVQRQYQTLLSVTKKPVGTDMMPAPMVSHVKLMQDADVVMFNHYNDEKSIGNVFFWFEYLKTLKKHPLWNTETDPCGNGSTAMQRYKPRGFCTLNSWLPFIFGGEANLYWHWRAHRAGHELMHGTVIDAHGRPTHTYGEVRRIAEDLKRCAGFLNKTRPAPAQIAIHYSARAEKLFSAQPMADGLRYQEILRDRFYEPLRAAGERVDIIPPEHSLDEYEVVISPLMPYIDEELHGKLHDWIEKGGVWIAGPLTDCRDRSGGKLTKPLGVLEEWCGAERIYRFPANPEILFDLHDAYGEESTGSVWYDGFKTGSGRAAAVYGSHSFEMTGLAAVVEKTIGKGKIILLGTVLQESFLLRLTGTDRSGQFPAAETEREITASKNVLAVPRVDENEIPAGVILAEYSGQRGSVVLAREAEELRSGEKFSGRIELAPYTVMVLSYLE